MANLIDRLVNKVDTIRQRVVDKFGIRNFDMYRVIRTWTDSEVGRGSSSVVETEIYPTPFIEIDKYDRLEGGGRVGVGKMIASQLSLTYTEAFLKGYPLVAGQECYYKLVERNDQEQETSYWILDGSLDAERTKIGWKLKFKKITIA